MDYSRRADVHLDPKGHFVQQTHIPEPEPPHGYYPVPLDYETGKLQRRDSRLKKNVRRLRLVSRVLTLILSAYMTATMSLTFHKYYSTRGIIIGGRNAWARDTKIWPTALLLGTSILTLLISLITVGLYCKGVSAANKANYTIGTVAIIAEVGTHMALWIGVSTAYRAGKDEHDLWGWTCSPKAGVIQGQFIDVINFERYCNIQSGSFATSVAQAVLAIAVVLGYILAFRRMRHKGKMEARAAELQQPTAYPHH